MVEIETIWTAEIISIIVLKQNSFVVSPAKQKRDICTAFPVASLSSAAASAA